MENKDLQFSKAGTSDALVLNCISKQAFDSDVDAGAPSKGGPPGYMSLPFHMKNQSVHHLLHIVTLQDNSLLYRSLL